MMSRGCSKVGKEIQINTRHCFRMEFRARAVFLTLKPFLGCHLKVDEACEMNVDKARYMPGKCLDKQNVQRRTAIADRVITVC